MVEALKEIGSKPLFSVLKGEGHGIQKVYSDQNIYKWLLSQHKHAYERFIEITSLWTPKVESVNSPKDDKTQKELVIKNEPAKAPEVPENQENKTGVKSFIYNLFNKKEPYVQSSLH